MKTNHIIAEIQNKVNLTANIEEAKQTLVELKVAKVFLDAQINAIEKIVIESDSEDVK